MLRPTRATWATVCPLPMSSIANLDAMFLCFHTEGKGKRQRERHAFCQLITSHFINRHALKCSDWSYLNHTFMHDPFLFSLCDDRYGLSEGSPSEKGLRTDAQVSWRFYVSWTYGQQELRENEVACSQFFIVLTVFFCARCYLDCTGLYQGTSSHC